jgi:hypothetical protein
VVPAVDRIAEALGTPNEVRGKSQVTAVRLRRFAHRGGLLVGLGARPERCTAPARLTRSAGTPP